MQTDSKSMVKRVEILIIINPHLLIDTDENQWVEITEQWFLVVWYPPPLNCELKLKGLSGIFSVGEHGFGKIMPSLSG